jgi:hypothetical protein
MAPGILDARVREMNDPVHMPHPSARPRGWLRSLDYPFHRLNFSRRLIGDERISISVARAWRLLSSSCLSPHFGEMDKGANHTRRALQGRPGDNRARARTLQMQS